MDLSAYLERIRFRGTPRVDLQTLTQLGRPLDLEINRTFHKLAEQQRPPTAREQTGFQSAAAEDLPLKETFT